MSSYLVSIGDIVLDIILPVTLPLMAENHQSTSYRRIEPGGASNVMITAARLGLDVAAVGNVGDDVFGAEIIRLLELENIYTKHIATLANSTSTIVAALTDATHGVHTFVGNFGKSSRVSYNAGHDQLLQNTSAVFFQGYTFIETSLVQLTKRFVENANELNIPVYFDVGPLLQETPLQDREWMLNHTDVIFGTEEEMNSVISGARGEAAVEHILRKRPNLVVMKQGDKGCTVFTKDERKSYPSFKIHVVDTVGAGDCFDATFMACMLTGRSLDECATIANAAGAANAQKIIAGRQSPTPKEINYVLAKGGSDLRWGE